MDKVRRGPRTPLLPSPTDQSQTRGPAPALCGPPAAPGSGQRPPLTCSPPASHPPGYRGTPASGKGLACGRPSQERLPSTRLPVSSGPFPRRLSGQGPPCTQRNLDDCCPPTLSLAASPPSRSPVLGIPASPHRNYPASAKTESEDVMSGQRRPEPRIRRKAGLGALALGGPRSRGPGLHFPGGLAPPRVGILGPTSRTPFSAEGPRRETRSVREGLGRCVSGRAGGAAVREGPGA